MTRVIKIGGRPQSDSTLPALVAEAWDSADRAVVIVHGGGDEVSALQQALGSKPRFVGGRRVTSAQDVDIVRMALSGVANKRLVAALVKEGVRAVGLSGEDGSLIAATAVDAEQLGHVGAPQRVNSSLLWHLLDAGYVPVISPVSRNVGLELGSALNVNGDDAAAAIAVALEADELLLVSDVEGVLVDGGPIARLTATTARQLIANGTAAGGMAAKLQAALTALQGGVKCVRIADLAAISQLDRGTFLMPDGEVA